MSAPTIPGAINVTNLTGLEIIEIGTEGSVSAQTTVDDIGDYIGADITPLVERAEEAAAEAEASAIEADLSAIAADASATNAEDAADIAVAAGANLGNMNSVADYLPGWPGPDSVLLAPDGVGGLAVVSSVVEMNERITALEERTTTTAIFDFLPGYSGDWIVYANGGLIQQGVINTTTSVGKSAATNAAIPRWMAASNALTLIGKGGQSLWAEGGSYTPYLIITPAPYPDNVIMPSVGIQPYGKTWNTTIPAEDQFYNGGGSQGSDPVGAIRSVSVAVSTRLYELTIANSDVEPLYMEIGDGAGGTTIAGLGPGSDPLQNFITQMEIAQTYAASQNLYAWMPFYIFTHCNEDCGWMTAAQYASWVRWIQVTLTIAARRIFDPTHPEVVVYVEQGTPALRAPADYYGVIQAEWDVCQEQKNLIRFLHPSYDLLHPDGTHMNSPNYYIRNLRNAETIFVDYFCGGFPALGIISARFVAADVIRAEIPVYKLPLHRDTKGNRSDFTITIASPAVVIFLDAPMPPNGTPLYLETDGALPTGVGTNQPFYVISATGTTCRLALTRGGAAINTTGSQSGTHTAIISGDGFQIDDGSATPPYVTSITIVKNGAYAIDVATFDAGTNVVTAFPALTLPIGTRVFFRSDISGGTLPPELGQNVTVYAFASALGTFKVAETALLAANSVAIDFSTAGTGLNEGIIPGYQAGEANSPAGEGVIDINLSAAPASGSTVRLFVGQLNGNGQGPTSGACTTLYDTGTGFSPIDITGASNETRLDGGLARQVLTVAR